MSNQPNIPQGCPAPAKTTAVAPFPPDLSDGKALDSEDPYYEYFKPKLNREFFAVRSEDDDYINPYESDPPPRHRVLQFYRWNGATDEEFQSFVQQEAARFGLRVRPLGRFAT